jgi:hypothetical protein
MAYMRNGLGEYEPTGNWSWEFYPPPYDFLAPPAVLPVPGVVMPEDRLQNMGGFSGLAGCGCGGKCGGGCGCGSACGCGGRCKGGLGQDSSTDATMAPIPAPTMPVDLTGDLSTFASTFTSSLSGPLQALSTSTILGVPAWVWLAGGALLYVWMFTGGRKYSRASRVKKRVSRAKSRAAGILPRFS